MAFQLFLIEVFGEKLTAKQTRDLLTTSAVRISGSIGLVAECDANESKAVFIPSEVVGRDDK